MKNSFEIIDDKGTVESGLMDFTEALDRLDELKEEGFQFEGDIKIVEVYYIE